MKKKLSILILSIFVLPIFALFGCNDVQSFGITVFSSSEALGAVSGYGTFEEDSTVTLYATPKTNGKFVAWIYQGSTLLSDGDIYKIESTEAKSTLSFNANAVTQGSYTAVFENKSSSQNNMMYIKLDSYRIASAESYQQLPAGIPENDSLETLITTNLTISHGKTSNNLNNVLTLENTELKDNMIYKPEDINQVLNLDAYGARHLCVQLNGKFVGNLNTTTKELRANIDYKESTTSQNQGYLAEVSYNTKGTYEIKFKFEQENQTYYLLLTYKNLSSETTA